MLHKRLRESRVFQHVQKSIARYEWLFMPGMLLTGTVVDAWQFKVLSIRTTFIISAVYALLCAGAILLMVAKNLPDRRGVRYAVIAAPFVQQFTIGALLSTSLLFYWFSGSFSVSWPIIGGIALVMIFNEVLRKYFARPLVQVTVFYFALFSLCATVTAYAFDSLSPLVFIGGGVLSLALIAVFLGIFLRVGELLRYRAHITLTMLGIFVGMHGAYFLNLIPPIPLSLREAGMYYSVARVGGEYQLNGETETWLQQLWPGQTLYLREGQPLYAFASVAAPAAMSATMVHRWEWYNDAEKEWVTMSTLQYGITGGRSDGYRGYSLKTNVPAGKWRVSVETPRGQVLGRIRSTVVRVE